MSDTANPTTRWARELAHLRMRSLDLRHVPAQPRGEGVAEAALAACDAILAELGGAYRECERLRTEVRAESMAWERLFELMPCACLVTDTQGLIVDANRAAGLVLNVAASRLKDRQLLVFTEARDAFVAVLKQLAFARPIQTTLTVRPRERRPAQMRVSVAPLGEQPNGLWLWFLEGAGEPLKPLSRLRRGAARAPAPAAATEAAKLSGD